MPQAYAFAGATMTVLVPGKVTNAAFAVLHVIKPSGSSTPPHSHDQEFELSYVLSGTLSAETEGRIETRSFGEVLVLPPGRPHRLFNESGETVREFLLCAPAMFDRFVAAAGSPVQPYSEPRPMSAEDRQRLVETAPGFGVRLLRSAKSGNASSPPLGRASWPQMLPGTGVEVLAQLGTGDNDLVLMQELIEVGHSVPLHSHAEPECVFVVEGMLEAYRDGSDWRRLGPSEALHVEPGRRHAFRTTGDRPVRLLTVLTGRMAHFVADAGSAERETLPALVAQYGHWRASAEENAAIGLTHA